jgi:pimeloyl-ACP methyl ester carboxylesterase
VGSIVAIEAGIAALVHLRKRKDWPGWAEWAKGLEKYGGIKVPREKWHDVDYMLRQSLKVPIVFGPARGLPRKKEKLLKLLDTTTLVKDYEHTAGMTVESLREVKHPVLLVYGNNSAYLGTHKVLSEALPNCTSALLKDCEHFGPLERPDRLVEHTRLFLEGGERSALSQEFQG